MALLFCCTWSEDETVADDPTTPDIIEVAPGWDHVLRLSTVLGCGRRGESEIRRWIMENDWLEGIVALPDQLFYNTGISTYFWILTNRKTPDRVSKIVLIDARDSFAKMRKSLGTSANTSRTGRSTRSPSCTPTPSRSPLTRTSGLRSSTVRPSASSGHRRTTPPVLRDHRRRPTDWPNRRHGQMGTQEIEPGRLFPTEKSLDSVENVYGQTDQWPTPKTMAQAEFAKGPPPRTALPRRF